MGNKYWIDVASHDIEACNVLRNNKLYAQSLFYFQQSIEKCSKYIGLEMGGFSDKELKEISHNPIKLFKKMAKKINKENDSYDSQYWDNELTESQKIITTANEDDAVNVFKVIVARDLSDIPTFGEETLKDYLRGLIEAHTPDIDKNELCILLEQEFHGKEKEYVMQMFLIDNHGERVLIFLLMLSLLLSRFKVDDFRYPSQEYGNPNDYFNEGRALVKELENLIIIMESYVLPMTKLIRWKFDDEEMM